MMRTSLVRVIRPLAAQRTFSTALRAMAEGDTGGLKTGGERASDAWSKREKGNEDMWIKQEERAKLLALKEKLKTQKQHIEELDKHIDELVKEQGGGEQH